MSVTADNVSGMMAINFQNFGKAKDDGIEVSNTVYIHESLAERFVVNALNGKCDPKSLVHLVGTDRLITIFGRLVGTGQATLQQIRDVFPKNLMN
ncbi:MAG: hypothetical protein KDJ15_00885 [Alphaproteobacteria bacterium]|nr:hypothetical protein [Alphaproteobacteria bacterium]